MDHKLIIVDILDIFSWCFFSFHQVVAYSCTMDGVMAYPDHKMAQRTPLVDLLTELQLTSFASHTIFFTGQFLSSAPGNEPEDAFILDLGDSIPAEVL